MLTFDAEFMLNRLMAARKPLWMRKSDSLTLSEAITKQLQKAGFLSYFRNQ
jgi:hypothetical protein